MTGGRLKEYQNIYQIMIILCLLMVMVYQVSILKSLKKFHEKNKKIVTVTAVRPPARFGELLIKK